jgi:hypothetical protein
MGNSLRENTSLFHLSCNLLIYIKHTELLACGNVQILIKHPIHVRYEVQSEILIFIPCNFSPVTGQKRHTCMFHICAFSYKNCQALGQAHSSHPHALTK